MNASMPNRLFSRRYAHHVMEPIYEEKLEPSHTGTTATTALITDLSEDDFVFDCGDKLVDLSNLISLKAKLLGPVKRPPRESSLSKQSRKPFTSMYPSCCETQALGTVDIAVMLERSQVVHPQQKMAQALRLGRQRLSGDYDYVPPSHPGENLPPGAYDCNQLAPPDPIGSSPHDTVQLEVAPGCFSPLRGSKETWAAISQGRSANVSCFGCSSSLVCIADAEYVLCPDCKVVSPTCVTETALDRKVPPGSCLPYAPLVTGGVGLGLRAGQLHL